LRSGRSCQRIEQGRFAHIGHAHDSHFKSHCATPFGSNSFYAVLDVSARDSQAFELPHCALSIQNLKRRNVLLSIDFCACFRHCKTGTRKGACDDPY
jgi:hypothetical protein